jgi:exonuclease SbcD
MKTSFAHLADVHLGNTQYNLSERFDDFGRAWLDVINQAITRKVSFVVIAGDLFEKRSVEPLALMKAQEGLRLLRRASIPAIAVEGNHDRALYREGFSWMEYLDAQGDLVLLDPYVATQRGCRFTPHKRGEGGSYIDIGGVRVVGQPYLGASAARTLEEMAAQMRLQETGNVDYVVFACHAGLEGIVARAPGCLTEMELSCIRPHVDYVAMGHIHQHFVRDGWLYNPGALETCRSDESDFASGFFIVEVDTDAEVKHKATLMSNWRRPFVRLTFSLDGLTGPDMLAENLQSFLHIKADAYQAEDEPVIELKLTGCLGFDPARLDLDAVKSWVYAVFNPLYVEVKDLTRRPDEAAPAREDETRDVIEHRVLTDLFERDGQYAPLAADWARLTATIKEMALSGSSPQELVNATRNGVIALGVMPAIAREKVQEGSSDAPA